MPDLAASLSALPIEVQAQAARAALSATDTSVKRIEASTPQTSAANALFWLVKIVGLVGGGYLVKWGIDIKAWTDSDLMLAVGTLATGGTVIWSFISTQIIKPWREHQIALASAAASAAATQAAGKPVEVPVQPPPAKM